MAFEVTTTGSQQHTNLSLLVVGPPGIGKTPFALTSPKPFLLNAEAGVASVSHLNANMAPVDSTKVLLEIRNTLALPTDERNDRLGFEVGTVVLDTIDEMQRIMIHERLQATRKTEMGPGDWGWLADEMGALARGFRSLDMNVIFVCHTKTQQEGETGEIRYVPDMSGAFGHQLPAAVDVVGRIERAAVLDENEEAATKHFFVSGYDRHYDWLKNRGKLPDSIELNFEDDYQRIHDTFFEGIEIHEADVRTIESLVDTEPPVEETKPEPEPEKTVDEAREQIDKAAEVMAVATEKKKADKMPVLAEPSKTKADLDLSGYESGNPVEDDQFTTAGFSLKDSGELEKAPKTRYLYRLEDGTEVLSVNQLEDGVVPVPDPEVGTGIFCQASGVEVTRDQAAVSRVAHRRVFSEAEFAKRSKKADVG